MEIIVELSKISKNYKHKKLKSYFTSRDVNSSVYPVLSDISLTVSAGTCVGLLGANGCGKSSLIKIISGIQRPDTGEIQVLNETPYHRKIKFLKNIGVVFGHKSSMWWDLPPVSSFKAFKSIYKIPDEIYEKNLEELKAALMLNDILHTPTRNLSLGERVKCEIAISLMHSPKLLLLDEPTIGLDASSKQQIRKYINRKVASGMSVMLTSHDASDIKECCSRALTLDKGRICQDVAINNANYVPMVTLIITSLSPFQITREGLQSILLHTTNSKINQLDAYQWEISAPKSNFAKVLMAIDQLKHLDWEIKNTDNIISLPPLSL